MIVVNLFYVDVEDMVDLLCEFYYELEFGLVLGYDGLDVMCIILVEVVEYLIDNGLLFVEVGNFMVYMEVLYLNVLFEWVEFE